MERTEAAGVGGAADVVDGAAVVGARSLRWFRFASTSSLVRWYTARLLYIKVVRCYTAKFVRHFPL